MKTNTLIFLLTVKIPEEKTVATCWCPLRKLAKRRVLTLISIFLMEDGFALNVKTIISVAEPNVTDATNSRLNKTSTANLNIYLNEVVTMERVQAMIPQWSKSNQQLFHVRISSCYPSQETQNLICFPSQTNSRGFQLSLSKTVRTKKTNLEINLLKSRSLSQKE